MNRQHIEQRKRERQTHCFVLSDNLSEILRTNNLFAATLNPALVLSKLTHELRAVSTLLLRCGKLNFTWFIRVSLPSGRCICVPPRLGFRRDAPSWHNFGYGPREMPANMCRHGRLAQFKDGRHPVCALTSQMFDVFTCLCACVQTDDNDDDRGRC